MRLKTSNVIAKFEFWYLIKPKIDLIKVFTFTKIFITYNIIDIILQYLQNKSLLYQILTIVLINGILSSER